MSCVNKPLDKASRPGTLHSTFGWHGIFSGASLSVEHWTFWALTFASELYYNRVCCNARAECHFTFCWPSYRLRGGVRRSLGQADRKGLGANPADTSGYGDCSESIQDDLQSCNLVAERCGRR